MRKFWAQGLCEHFCCLLASPRLIIALQASETLAKWLKEAKETVRMRRGIGQIRVIDRYAYLINLRRCKLLSRGVFAHRIQIRGGGAKFDE